MSQRSLTVTQVGIVGGGPAGLMLSHLLAQAGIDSVVIDNRTRREIEETVRAGILERDSVRLLVESGVSDRVLTEGHEHAGIDLRFSGLSHRIDFQALIGESVWLYPQTDVFIDLADARERDSADVRFGISGSQVLDLTSDQPGIIFTDAAGAGQQIRCDYLIGADGSRSICRMEVPESERRHYFREYPFAWLGILAEAPPSAPELTVGAPVVPPVGFEPTHTAVACCAGVRPNIRAFCQTRHQVDGWSVYRFLSPGGQVYLIDGLCRRENQERARDRTG
jgi:p-hydroxybenzoate 3-monooxygenase